MLNFGSDAASGETHFLREHLGRLENPIVFDVGANEGAYTLAVAEANPRATVYAFEPHPTTYGRLLSRISDLQGVVAVNSACGSAKGSLLLFDYAGSEGTSHASVYEQVMEMHGAAQTGRHTVSIISLDCFAEQNGVGRIDLLKIDTEGHELEVLKGAAGLLRAKRIGAIQFEFNEMNIVSRVFFKDFRDLLPNYRFHRMVRDGLIPLDPYSPIRCEFFVFQNIVALPDATH